VIQVVFSSSRPGPFDSVRLSTATLSRGCHALQAKRDNTSLGPTSPAGSLGVDRKRSSKVELSSSMRARAWTWDEVQSLQIGAWRISVPSSGHTLIVRSLEGVISSYCNGSHHGRRLRGWVTESFIEDVRRGTCRSPLTLCRRARCGQKTLCISVSQGSRPLRAFLPRVNRAETTDLCLSIRQEARAVEAGVSPRGFRHATQRNGPYPRQHSIKRSLPPRCAFS